MDTLQTFELYDVQLLLAAPGGLSTILKFYEENPAFRCSFRSIITAGSALPKPLSERVRARLSSNLVFFYGSSETSAVAAAPAHMVADIPGAVGHVLPEATVEIVDGSQRMVRRGEQGSVRIRTPMMADGYHGDPEQTRASFRDGCFYPGDLGYLTPDGMLVISGREREVLNLGGVKTTPQFVEDVLSAFAAVDQAAVVAMPNSFGVDELWALVVQRGPVDLDALRLHCQQKLSALFCPVRFIKVENLPRNPNGKLDRPRLRELARAAELDLSSQA